MNFKVDELDSIYLKKDILNDYIFTLKRIHY